MSEIYGAQWINEYGATPNKQWSREIRALSPEKVLRGVEQCKRNCSAYIVKLPQFLAYCSDGMTSEQRALYARCADGQKMLSLPRPPINRELVKTYITAMKEAVL